nr:receptor-like protein 12 [Ipomoea batatas]
MRNCQVSSPIHPSLSKLHFLSEIYLDKNDFSSTVPKFFANFLNLKTLSLWDCNLLGEFPREIFQLQGLQELSLADNQKLSGSFPSFPKNGSLPASISNLSNLSRIDLSVCKFSGSIPSTMAQLTSLVYVDFSYNNFTGSIPHFRWSKNLEYIGLSLNGLTGSLSSKHFGGLSEIVNIYLGYNFFNGSIPYNLGSYAPFASFLSLTNNSFTGVIPESICNASDLLVLDLSNNKLNGILPSCLFHIPLGVLNLGKNQITGNIPDSFPSNCALKTLDLGRNVLEVDISSGSLTSSFLPQISVLKMASCRLQKFPNLRTHSSIIILDLSDNEIRGEIPNWIWNVGNGSLVYLNLSCNFLDGLEKPYTIPSYLSVLDLHSNQLQGQIPMASTSGALYLDYSNNFFNSSIPYDLGSYASFASFLSLSNNSFTGPIPESLCNASYLKVLDLSNNKLNGILPSCLFSNFRYLGVLNFGKNQITGNIPDLFPRNCALKTLDLGRNVLEGRIPSSLINCSFLEVLNLGSNKIVDTFPCPLQNLSSLRVLVLRSNGFHGNLHCVNADHMWPNLQIIDIASNNFTGELSPKLLNWKGMTVDEDNIAQSRGNIRFDFLRLNDFYYQDKVLLTVKGVEMELVKILRAFTSSTTTRKKIFETKKQSSQEQNHINLSCIPCR